jgi:hypothetical protein
LFSNKNLPVKTRMEDFWSRHTGTTDDVKERPYTQVYSRLTTRSNSYTVHYRVQVLQKARGSNPTRFDRNRDSIVSDQRGSFLVERFIDPTDTAILDYAAALSANPSSVSTIRKLDAEARFRVVSGRRFQP